MGGDSLSKVFELRLGNVEEVYKKNTTSARQRSGETASVKPPDGNEPGVFGVGQAAGAQVQ